MGISNYYKVLIFFSLIFIISSTHLKSKEDGFISVSISEKGLDFVKDLLIDKAVSSITPLELPDIEKTVRIILVGKVKMVLSNIIIYHIDVNSSNIDVTSLGSKAINQSNSIIKAFKEVKTVYDYYKVLIFFSLIFIISSTHLKSKEDGFISVSISEKGLDFVKDLLIDKAVSSITPLELPDIEKTVRIILVGKVKMVLSNIIIYHIDVNSSNVELSDSGVTITASKATANLSMDWKYTYKNWLVEVSDQGKASVQVEDMEVGLTTSLKSQEGSLELSILESSCDVKDVNIKVEGGASWLYQGLVDAFSNHIESAVSNAILKKLKEGVSKIGSLLQSLPKEVKVDDTSALNVTFVVDPILSDSSISFVINGLFTPRHESLISLYQHRISQAGVAYDNSAKMIAMSLHEDVLNSASAVYFNAGLMHWRVDKIPDQSLLNTTEWREVVPRLYDQFPNENMVLDLLISSPPSVHILDDKVEATISGDITVDVLNDGEVIPVACISLVFTASGFAKISTNNLTGSVELDDFSLSSKWSKVGNLQIDVIEPMISEALKDVLLPDLNQQLMKGFPLPLIHGFSLEDAKIVYSDSKIMIGSDVTFVQDLQLPTKYSFKNIFDFISSCK